MKQLGPATFMGTFLLFNANLSGVAYREGTNSCLWNPKILQPATFQTLRDERVEI